ncbi:MAG: hypothetical protein C0518_00590 [Opitutus sp.]|nr:hypothetical protein [Opitutus sp.]
MEQTLQFGRLVQCLVERGCFARRPFTLIDAGCSGGIAGFWRRFEPSLRAVGIDPVGAECDRLAAAETNSAVSYTRAFVGLPPDHPFVAARGQRPPTERNPWPRLSAPAGADILRERTQANQALPLLNDWDRASLPADPTPRTIDSIVDAAGFSEVDFIKIDIDGYDLDALLSAERTIKSSPVLGLALEVNFYGSASPMDHTFHNTDRLMREWGFELFDLSVRRYSTAALPQPYQWNIPAQTVRGRPFQGDAIYLRDPCSWDAVPETAVPLDAIKLLKLSCLFSLFGLPDHAAELLRDHSASLADVAAAEPLLHLLANEVKPSLNSYHEYLRQFREDPTSFYPDRWVP